MLKDLVDWSGQKVGSVEISDYIFSAPKRKDILHRVIQWQLAKRRSGNHKTKEIGDVSGTTRKPFKQKGTGRARQGSLRSPQFRGGAVIFGPVVRSHAYSLNKKIRQFGLRVALSTRLADDKIMLLKDCSFETSKTKEATKLFSGKSVLIVTGSIPCENIKRAIQNIPRINILPCHGLNVYDIMRHDFIYIASEALDYIQKRLDLTICEEVAS